MAFFTTIDTISTPTSISTSGDTSQPYTFQAWRARNNNVSPNDIYKQYIQYVQNWYLNKTAQNTNAISTVQSYYLTFLTELGLTARTIAEQQFFNNVNFSDPLSIQSVIVGYARKLKDIAVYIAQQRHHVIYTKLKYNLVGTSTALERLFYNYLLSAFTQKQPTEGAPLNEITSTVITNPSILAALPYLSSISSQFSIEIEELYDTNNYFDRDPSMPISTYTAVASGVPAALYEAGEYQSPAEYIIVNTIAQLAQ